MTKQEIKYMKENSTILSLFIRLIEFIKSEIDNDKDKSD